MVPIGLPENVPPENFVPKLSYIPKIFTDTMPGILFS
jgi:hypothetical protein